jgi:hypothetical protein
LSSPPHHGASSACVVVVVPSNRSSRWSVIDTTTREPSGSQPSPEGCVGTSRTTVSSPAGDTRLTVPR